jgi:hypothetical protein
MRKKKKLHIIFIQIDCLLHLSTMLAKFQTNFLLKQSHKFYNNLSSFNSATIHLLLAHYAVLYSRVAFWGSRPETISGEWNIIFF